MITSAVRGSTPRALWPVALHQPVTAEEARADFSLFLPSPQSRYEKTTCRRNSARRPRDPAAPGTLSSAINTPNISAVFQRGIYFSVTHQLLVAFTDDPAYGRMTPPTVAVQRNGIINTSVLHHEISSAPQCRNKNSPWIAAFIKPTHTLITLWLDVPVKSLLCGRFMSSTLTCWEIKSICRLNKLHYVFACTSSVSDGYVIMSTLCFTVRYIQQPKILT